MAERPAWEPLAEMRVEPTRGDESFEGETAERRRAGGFGVKPGELMTDGAEDAGRGQSKGKESKLTEASCSRHPHWRSIRITAEKEPEPQRESTPHGVIRRGCVGTTAPPTLTQRATNGVFSLIDPFSFGEVSAHTRLLSGEPQIPLKGILPSEEDVFYSAGSVVPRKRKMTLQPYLP